MTAATKKPKVPPAKPASDYDEDFYTWLNQQAALLRARAFDELDIENLAEEIEDLGKEQFNKLVSAYRIILLHMLKWDHQPTHRSRSWAGSIKTQRLSLVALLEDNPGLKSRRKSAVDRAFQMARIEAATETRLPEAQFPASCAYSLDDISNRNFPFD